MSGLGCAVLAGLAAALARAPGAQGVAGQRLLQMSAPVAERPSGGPVLDLAGRVVGMTAGISARGARRVPDAAQEVREIGPGDLVRGRLERGDLILDDGSYADVFILRGREGQRVRIELRSSDFDAYLAMLDTAEGGVIVAEDDDGAGGTDARVEVELPAGGAWLVVVSSYEPGEMGAYRLDVSGDQGRWASVHVGDDAVWSLDRRTLRRTGSDRYRAWVRVRYDEVRDAGNIAYDRTLADLEVDCRRRRIRVHATRSYLGSDPVEAGGVQRPTAWYDVVPETVAELLWTAVCRSER